MSRQTDEKRKCEGDFGDEGDDGGAFKHTVNITHQQKLNHSGSQESFFCTALLLPNTEYLLHRFLL